MANQAIALNGSPFTPSSIEMTPERIADMRRARNGKLHLYHWGNKRKWSLNWTGVHEDLVPAIRAIGELVNTFTFVDVDGTPWVVIVPPGGYTQSLSADRQSISGIYYYDLTIELEQE